MFLELGKKQKKKKIRLVFIFIYMCTKSHFVLGIRLNLPYKNSKKKHRKRLSHRLTNINYIDIVMLMHNNHGVIRIYMNCILLCWCQFLCQISKMNAVHFLVCLVSKNHLYVIKTDFISISMLRVHLPISAHKIRVHNVYWDFIRVLLLKKSTK